MIITVTHLTRMRYPHICVAGVNTLTGESIRPVCRHQRLSISDLACNGGVFDIGAIVDLGSTRSAAKIPEVEDHDFDLGAARRLGYVSAFELWNLVTRQSRPSFNSIFGSDLLPHRRTAIVEVGSGDASLGYFTPMYRPRVFVDDYKKARLETYDGDSSYILPIADARLHCIEVSDKGFDSRFATDHGVINDIVRRINSGEQCVLAVGLTRPYKPKHVDRELHWLQVNNVYLFSCPDRKASMRPALIDDDFSDIPF